ncbi:MAG TPA: hypothetical protein DEA08_17385 [Planctomycetes bacterium]|nr:hypothetical protein [Planctomycetota bacterium]
MNAPLSAAALPAAVPECPLPLYARLILRRPGQIRRNLERVRAAGIVPLTPNTWQVFLGVMRMLYRLWFHPENVGTSADVPERDTLRARLWRWRPLRAPFLLWEGSITPLDLSGLASSPERVMTHLLGTYHADEAFVYDLRLLEIHPGKLEELRREAAAVASGEHPRAAWLADLCVYDGYHSELLAAVERALQGDFSAPTAEHSDTTLVEYLNWCASRPATPAETWAAWRSGELGLGDPAPQLGLPGSPSAEPEAVLA